MIIDVKKLTMAKLQWGVGTSYITATGGGARIAEVTAGQKIQVPYPTMIYISVLHKGSSTFAGEFTFDYSYEDNEPEDAGFFDGLYIIEGTESKL